MKNLSILSFVLIGWFGFAKPIALRAQDNHCLTPPSENTLQQNHIETYTEAFTLRKSDRSPQARRVVTIPVVVHVVWRLAEENISEAQVLSQIETLNQDFRKLNTDFSRVVPIAFQNVAADCDFEFCLARQTPDGNASNGITRTRTLYDNIGSSFGSNNRRRIYYSSLGGVNNWKPADYLNIWVCKLESGFGYATPLSEALQTPAEDGIMIDFRAFGKLGTATAPQNLGRTATHEIGHYFNLNHIWGNDFDCANDDLVGDTPVQARPYSGCPSFPQVSCGNSNMFMNFMDYTDDACMGFFTLGQKTRMLVAFQGFRAGLGTSKGCQMPNSVNISAFKGRIYPNPTSDNLLIETGSLEGLQSIDVLDLMGCNVLKRELTAKESNPLIVQPLEALADGVYILVLNFGNHTFRQKIIVAR
jgi:hypothetical protein